MPVKKDLPANFVLRIELQHSDPLIWRTIVVPSTISLVKLHQAIQYAMGWWNGHLHEFEIDGIRYGMIDPEWDLDPELEDEKRKRLNKVLGTRKTFTYLYDYGDSWLHKIKVQKVIPTLEPMKFIFCAEGENACPPEDIGGLHGYYYFLDVINDPKHDEYEDMRNWIGQDNFDPAFFDEQQVNRLLQKIKI